MPITSKHEECALVCPVINMNGTSGDRLLEDYIAMMDAVRGAVDVLSQKGPHGRDYQHDPSGLSYRAAADQHRQRVSVMSAILDDLEQIAVDISNQNEEREARHRSR